MAERIIRPGPPPPRLLVSREGIERLREHGASEDLILYAEWMLRRQEDERRWRRWLRRRLRRMRWL